MKLQERHLAENLGTKNISEGSLIKFKNTPNIDYIDPQF